MRDHSEKIQDYINGLLQGDELFKFEEQLTLDVDLRNMLSLQKEVNSILNTHIISFEVEARTELQHNPSNFRYSTHDFKLLQSDFIWVVSVFTILMVVSLIVFVAY